VKRSQKEMEIKKISRSQRIRIKTRIRKKAKRTTMQKNQMILNKKFRK
jgi:hypothetical protein